MARVYATVEDYEAFTGQPADGVTEATLARASMRIDRVLIGAIYETDDAGMPTDAVVVEAMRDATCAQAQYWEEIGDTSGQGTGSQYGEVEIGNVRLRRSGNGAYGSGAEPGKLLSPVAVDILQVAGLWPTVPYVYG